MNRISECKCLPILDGYPFCYIPDKPMIPNGNLFKKKLCNYRAYYIAVSHKNFSYLQNKTIAYEIRQVCSTIHL